MTSRGTPTSTTTAPGNTLTALQVVPEHAQRIAYLIAGWTNIELQLIILLAMLARTDQQIVFPMLYSIQSSRSRVDAIEAALHKLLTVENDRTTIDDFLTRARSLLKLRDKFAHAAFGYSGSPETGYELSIIRMRGSPQHETVQLHDLDHQLGRANTLQLDIIKFINALMGVPIGPNSPAG